MRITIAVLVLLVVGLNAIKETGYYPLNKSYVTHISSINYQKQIIKTRETSKSVLIIHFYSLTGTQNTLILSNILTF